MFTGIIADSVSFYCIVEASPPPTIVWLINGTVLDVASEGNVFEKDAGLITVNSTLNLLKIDLLDIGQYSCNASNDLVELRSDTSEELFLEVLRKYRIILLLFVVTLIHSYTVADPPNITAVDPIEVVINQTQEASFTCQAYGVPLPNITWTKVSGGTVVENITGFTEIDEFLIPPSTLMSVLTFVEGMNSDESMYSCEASNRVPNLIGSPETDGVILLVQGIVCTCYLIIS